MILTSEECERCGGHHHSSLHGESLVIVDHGRDSIIGTFRRLLDECMALVGISNAREAMVPYNQEAQELYQADRGIMQFASDESDLGERIAEFCDEAESRLTVILRDAGYLLDNNADAGCWLVFNAVEDDNLPSYNTLHHAISNVLDKHGIKASHETVTTLLDEVLDYLIADNQLVIDLIEEPTA